MISDTEIIKILKDKKIFPSDSIKKTGSILIKSLWILKIVKDNHIVEALSPQGISNIAHHILDEDINKNSISKAFSRAGKKIKRHPGGFYEIMGPGREELKKLDKKSVEKPRKISSLFKKIKNKNEQEFIDEAMKCLDVGAERSTIIMLWCATLYKIYQKIENKGFDKFNNAYLRRYSRVKEKLPPLKKIDGFEYYPDSIVLQICEDIEIFDKTQRRILQEDCLKLRNMCAHPSKYKPKEYKINSFIEDILEIVFK